MDRKPRNNTFKSGGAPFVGGCGLERFNSGLHCKDALAKTSCWPIQVGFEFLHAWLV